MNAKAENITKLEQTVLETQQSIVKWATETFGVPTNATMIAVRALEESVELSGLFFRDEIDPVAANVDNIGSEIADVFIVACQVAQMFNVTLNLVEGNSQNARAMVCQQANICAVLVAATIDENVHITPHLRTLQMTLAHLAKSVGEENLQTLVNEKMAINRARKWEVGFGGIGQHVEEAKDVMINEGSPLAAADVE